MGVNQLHSKRKIYKKLKNIFSLVTIFQSRKYYIKNNKLVNQNMPELNNYQNINFIKYLDIRMAHSQISYKIVGK